MNKNYKHKICKICNILYKPNSPMQKYCHICGLINRKNQHLQANRTWLRRNKDKHNESSKIWRYNNKEHIKITSKIWYNKNKNTILIHRKNNPLYILIKRIRSITYKSIKNIQYRKNKKSIEYLGCNIEFLKQYLESKFTPEMNWDNYGKYPNGWDIDHIIPLSTAKNIKELIPLLHYTNLQPLNSRINRDIKKNKII